MIKTILSSNIFIAYLIQLVAMTSYSVLWGEKERLHHFLLVFVSYAILNLSNFVVVIVSFPIAFILRIKIHTIEAELLNIVLHLVLYSVLALVFEKRKLIEVKEITRISSIGTVLLLVFSECIFLAMRYVGYDDGNTMLYNMCLVAIGFGVIIVILWRYDKFQEQKRVQELLAYTHRTREVIPSVSRVLGKLEDMSVHVEKTNEIIKELKLICDADMNKTQKEVADIKTFESTGCFSLDEQLERYMEEATEKGFHLDVIVRASLKEILDNKNIDIYSLMQIVGDLYRNACKAILKIEKQGRILMCFGYNQEGYYEFSIHDNGEIFSQYVLQHLGERGVTTGGTGQGMADVFEVLAHNQISFVLKQDFSKNRIFTKSISLVFDGKGERII